MTPLQTIASRLEWLNLSGIEREANIPRTSLSNAIGRGQTSFKWDDKLKEWIDKNLKLD